MTTTTKPSSTLINPGQVMPPDSIRFERRLPGPIERVWSYLTDSEKRGTWLASGPMDLRPGGRADLQFQHANITDHPEPAPERFKCHDSGVGHECRVVRCEAPRLLTLAWSHGSKASSEVTFELSPAGQEVLLVLTHRRLPDRDEMRLVSGGWHTHLAILEDELSRRERRAFWSNFERAEAEYDKLIPRS